MKKFKNALKKLQDVYGKVMKIWELNLISVEDVAEIAKISGDEKLVSVKDLVMLAWEKYKSK